MMSCVNVPFAVYFQPLFIFRISKLCKTSFVRNHRNKDMQRNFKPNIFSVNVYLLLFKNVLWSFFNILQMKNRYSDILEITSQEKAPFIYKEKSLKSPLIITSSNQTFKYIFQECHSFYIKSYLKRENS